MVICDEVYEHLAYDGRPHIPFATLPGMRERTVRIGSAGKIFSLTGWKVGWVTGPRELISVIAKAHQFLTFTTPPALQLGVAHGLAHEMEFPSRLPRGCRTIAICWPQALTSWVSTCCPARAPIFSPPAFPR